MTRETAGIELGCSFRCIRYQHKAKISRKGREIRMVQVDDVEHDIAHLVDLGIRLCCCQDKIVGMNLIDPQLVILGGFHRKPG